MPTTEQLTCPKCHGQLAKVFTGQRQRTFACPKCGPPTRSHHDTWSTGLGEQRPTAAGITIRQ
jgi:ssDNA-binding Zn-finger/Zn-ribbon topoisomerase 1